MTTVVQLSTEEYESLIKKANDTDNEVKHFSDRLVELYSSEGNKVNYKIGENNYTIICPNPNDAIIELKKAVEELSKPKKRKFWF